MKIRTILRFLKKQTTEDIFATTTAIVLFIWGLVLLIIVPPFQTPDEPQHAYRAWDLANGHALCNKATYTVNVPSYIEAVRIAYPREQVQFSGLGMTHQSEAPFQTSNNAAVSVYSQFCAYNPIGYIGTTIGAVIAKTISLNGIAAILLMRMCNLVIASIIVFFAIRLTPIGKPVFAAISLLPMMAFQLSSISSDAIAYPLLLLFTACVLQATQQKKITNKYSAFLVGLSLVAIHAKPGYIVFILLFMAIQPRQYQSPRQYWRWALLLLSLHLIALWLTSAIATVPAYYNGYYEHIAPKDQLVYVVQHPLLFTSLVIDSLSLSGWVYIEQITGYFGWLTIVLPPGIILFCGTSLLWVLTHWEKETTIHNRTRAIFIATGVLGIYSLFVIAYLTWSPYKNDAICCLQGRYFLPYIWLFIIGIWQLRPTNKTIRITLAIIIGIYILSTLQTILTHHYL